MQFAVLAVGPQYKRGILEMNWRKKGIALALLVGVVASAGYVGDAQMASAQSAAAKTAHDKQSIVHTKTTVRSSGKASASKHRGQAVATEPKASFPLTILDEAGHRVKISKPPVRIASTTEGTDEILSALVPRKNVVMVTTFASQPLYSNVVGWAKGIRAINQVNAEQVLSVKPDLVLMASYNSPGVVAQIEQTGAPVFEFANFNSIRDIEANIALVGRLVGQQPRADRVVQAMKKQLGVISHDVAQQHRVTVLDYSSYGYAAGKNTTVDSIIRHAGGINAASNISGWKMITDEEIVKMNPQVIIDARGDSLAKIIHNPALASVAAIKNHRVYYVNGAELSAVSQYIVRGVRDVAHTLYPNVTLPADSQLQ